MPGGWSMPENWGDIVRIANIMLSVALMYVCNMRVFRDWPLWTRRERVVRVHVTAYLFVLAYATIEQLAADSKPGFRVVLVLLVHISFALALFRNRHDPATDR